MRIPGVNRKPVNRDEIWVGHWASHFVCIAFSFFILLVHCILEKRSNAVEATTAKCVLLFLYKKKKEMLVLHAWMKSHSSSVCLLFASARAVLAALSFSFHLALGAFHWHHRLSDWQTSILYDPRVLKALFQDLTWKDLHFILIQRLFVNKYKAENVQWNADGCDSTAHDVHK